MDRQKPFKTPRMMICGDSMTQGSEGDWTWRYRLWEWLRSQDSTFVFTGPYTGTREAESASPPKPPPLYHHRDPQIINHHGGYARGIAKDFDSHHFSVWGRQCAVAKDLIEEALIRHPADILLVMLGFNDIGWLVSDAEGTLESMSVFVKNARKTNPNVRILLANIPQRTKMDGREDLPVKTREYNRLLAEAIPYWCTEASPIHLVKLCEEYDAEVGSYDGLHPNAIGEYQIARAFSLAIVKHLIPHLESLVIPDNIPSRKINTPRRFKLVSSPRGVTATWDQVYGCQYYELRLRSGNADFSIITSGSNRWDSHWVSDNDVYQAQVRACYGQTKSDFTPMLNACARPSLAPAPQNVKIRSASKGIIVSWDPPEGDFTGDIVQYNILWNDRDDPNAFLGLAAFQTSPAHIDELQEGHTIDLFMLTWTAAGEGLPGSMQQFIVGS